MYKKTLCALLALVWVSAFSLAAFGQAGCEAPALTHPSQARENLFSPAMEASFADFLGDQIQGKLRLSADPAMTRHLQEVGARLVAQLPPTGIHFHFYLVDLAEPNAFSIVGGRVYVSQSLVAFLHNDDELAGVLAHEIGHIVTHQEAIEFSQLFRRVLGVTAIPSSSELRRDMARLQDNWARDPGAFRKSHGASTAQEEVADQIALYAMARAGYSPQSFVDAFNRLAETHGKTGNWLNNLLGLTDVDTRRLKDQIQTLQQMPRSCIETRKKDPKAFDRWQLAVSEFSDWDRKEILPGQLTAVKLSPPLQPEIDHVRFSPDGKFILAQNGSRIFILTHHPFAYQFSIHASEAGPAHFTPDSSAVVFNTRSLRVEKWNLASRKRQSVFMPVVPTGCMKTALSPQGTTLACFRPDKKLVLVDVASGKVIFQKDAFDVESFSENPSLSPRVVHGDIVGPGGAVLITFEVLYPEMGFSPDGHYFVAANTLAWACYDLRAGKKVKLPGSLVRDLKGSFAFVGNGKVLAHEVENSNAMAAVSVWGEHRDVIRGKAVELSFPAGKELRRYKIGAGGFFAPVSEPGRATVYFGSQKYREGVFDLGQKKFLLLDKKERPLDVHGSEFAIVNPDGSLGLFGLKTLKAAGVVTPPGSPLDHFRVGAFSSDLKWLAVSLRDHGGLWNLQSGQRLYGLRGFRGAWFEGSAGLIADFPAWGKRKRSMLGIALAQRRVVDEGDIQEKHAWQMGRYLVVTKPAHDTGSSADLGRDVTLEIRNVISGKVLWSRHFPKSAPVPGIEPNQGTVSLLWPAADGAVKDEAGRFPALAEEIHSDKTRSDDYFAESFAISSGKPLGAALITTGKGSFDVSDFFAEGGRLFVASTSGQVMVYSLADGKQAGNVFGSNPVVDGSGSLMAVEAAPSELKVYRLPSLSEAARYYFSSRVLWTRFSQDGKQLAVLAADQTVHFLDVSHSSAPAVAASSAKP